MKQMKLILQHKLTYRLWVLLGFGLLVRIWIYQTIDFAFNNDVHTFQSWATILYNYGLGQFYSSPAFTDYPPMYMYVLYIVGFLRSVFDWQTIAHPEASQMFRFMIFFPAIIADLLIGLVLYFMVDKSFQKVRTSGKKRTKTVLNDSFALFIVALWLFNPAIILVSSVWGQVESVFVLLLLLSLILVKRKNLLFGYILFGIAILTKPQSLFIAPVYLYSAISYFTEKHENRSWYLPLSIFGAALVMVIVSIPFGLQDTLYQITRGIDSYNFATINAYNLWAVFGGNWISLDTTFLGISYTIWGIGIVAVIILASLWVLHIDHTKHNGKHWYLIVAGLFMLIFVFSVKMHERYLFPALVFLLIHYWENRNNKVLGMYFAFTITYFYNCFDVLSRLNSGFWGRELSIWAMWTSVANVILAIFFIWVTYCTLFKNSLFRNRIGNRTGNKIGNRMEIPKNASKQTEQKKQTGQKGQTKKKANNKSRN